MPPLKMLSASPTLQIACPGRGCVRDLSICAAQVQTITNLDIKPLVRTRRENLQPTQAVVKERLVTGMGYTAPETLRFTDSPAIRSPYELTGTTSPQGLGAEEPG